MMTPQQFADALLAEHQANRNRNMGTTSRSPFGAREASLADFYAAERRAGADPLTANGRMHEFAKRLDAMTEQRKAADDAFNRDLETIRHCMERTR